MVTKHTPGPWQINGSHIYGRDPERDLVCQARNWPVHGAADQRLIAAAPDMLAALEYLVSKPHGEQIHDAFDMAHRAIAKARGE